jgi:hypothetical protein
MGTWICSVPFLENFVSLVSLDAVALVATNTEGK